MGAVIVDENNKIVGIGYNSMPVGCDDDDMPWSKGELKTENKHSYGQWTKCGVFCVLTVRQHRLNLKIWLLCWIQIRLVKVHSTSKILIFMTCEAFFFQ